MKDAIEKVVIELDWMRDCARDANDSVKYRKLHLAARLIEAMGAVIEAQDAPVKPGSAIAASKARRDLAAIVKEIKDGQV